MMLNTALFLESLAYLGKGMLGILIVMLLLAGCIALLNRIFHE